MSANNPVKTNKPLDWLTTLNLSEEVKDLLFDIIKNSDGQHAKGNFDILIDPTSNPMKAFGAANPFSIIISDPTTPSAKQYVGSVGVTSTFGTTTEMVVGSEQFVANIANANFEAIRAPTKWLTVPNINAAGNTAVWTPAAGKKFRLMGWTITLSKEAACAGAYAIQLKDAAAVFHEIDVSAAALVAQGIVNIWTVNYPSNGMLSSAINNVLNLGEAALTAGVVSFNGWGTEE